MAAATGKIAPDCNQSENVDSGLIHQHSQNGRQDLSREIVPSVFRHSLLNAEHNIIFVKVVRIYSKPSFFFVITDTEVDILLLCIDKRYLAHLRSYCGQIYRGILLVPRFCNFLECSYALALLSR